MHVQGTQGDFWSPGGTAAQRCSPCQSWHPAEQSHSCRYVFAMPTCLSNHTNLILKTGFLKIPSKTGKLSKLCRPPRLSRWGAWSCGLITIAMAWVLSLTCLFVIISYTILIEYQFIKEPGKGVKIKTGLFQIKVLQANISVI